MQDPREDEGGLGGPGAHGLGVLHQGHRDAYYAMLCYATLYLYYTILYYTITILYYTILYYTILKHNPEKDIKPGRHDIKGAGTDMPMVVFYKTLGADNVIYHNIIKLICYIVVQSMMLYYPPSRRRPDQPPAEPASPPALPAARPRHGRLPLPPDALGAGRRLHAHRALGQARRVGAALRGHLGGDEARKRHRPLGPRAV